MTRHVIIGAGPVGAATAALLAERGDQVTLVTRSGSGPEHAGVLRVRADAADTAAMTTIAEGAVALYNCANPLYHRWPTAWPPIASALLTAAQHSGAVLATVSNLYGYGPVDGPMTESTPLNPPGVKGRVRVQMWLDALRAHQEGRVKVTEIRASDYLGPRATSHLGERVVPRILAGKGVQLIGSADARHTWTFVDDVARLLAIVGTDERAWGRAWHVPSNPPRTQREAVGDLARAAGVGRIPVSTVPALLLRALGLVNPVIRELPEVMYQFRQPFVLDSSAAQETFGLRPTAWADVIEATLSYYRQETS